MGRYVKVDACESVRDFYHDVIAHAMRRTAAAKTLTDNPLSTRARKWKKDQAIISLTLGEMEELIKNKNLRIIAEQKVDGQSAIMEFDGREARFASLHDRLYDELPVLNEIAAILKKQGVTRALMVGEMAVADKGKVVPFEESQSVIKGADRDKSRIHWYPYQILEIDGEAYGEGFETYLKGWKRIKDLFKSAERVHPVESSAGGVAELKSAWKKMVENEQNEGLVVRTSDGRVYKCKPEFSYDLVVIAVGDKKLKNWPKGMVGSTLMAFMDTDRVFRVAGEVGTGLTQAESRELFQWAQKNSVGEDDHYTWVKPEKIMEVQYDRSVVRDVVSYKYEKGKYEKVEKRMGGTIIKPRFIRWRDDKKVTPEDLRLTQIPNWKAEQREAALRVAANFKTASVNVSGIVKKIGLPSHRGAYVIHGSTSLYARGLRNAVNDLDIITSPEVFKELQKKYPENCRMHGSDEQVFLDIDGIKVEIFTTWWGGMDPSKIIRQAENIDGVWYASLEDVREWKALRWEKEHLEKDKKDLEAINQSLGIKTADYPDHPDDVVLPGIKEVDIWNYYSGVKGKMLSELKGREMFIGIVPKGYKKGQKPVYVRHPYDKKTDRILINSEKDFETYHSGRTVEYHITMPRMAPYYVIDYDAGEEPFPQTKKVVAEIADGLGKLPEVKSVEIRYTGKRGFHVLGWLKKARDVDEARDFLRGWLKENFGEREDVTIAESPSGKKGALGLSPMKENGGQVALWSLRVTGRCCVEVPRSGLMSFDKKDATMEKVYKKATGNVFTFGKMTKQASRLRGEVQKAKNAELPVIFLGGLCEDDNEWRKEIKKEFGDKLFFLDPYDKNWDPADNIYDELAGMLIADHVVFYKGGKGSKHEQIFLDMISEDRYDKFEDLNELKTFLNNYAKPITERVARAYLKLSMPWLAHADLFLESLSKEDAIKVLRDLVGGKTLHLPAYKGYPEQKLSPSDLTKDDRIVLRTFPWGMKGNPRPRFHYENGHYLEIPMEKTAGYDREVLKSGYKGRFVIHDHDADKAGRHWDLRLEFPVTSMAKALGHYDNKRTEDTPEPGDKFPDKPGTVYRSFAVRKHRLPTKDSKLLIVETENHPIAYGTFEGPIPEGEYGAGDVSVWDHGTYEITDVEGDKKYVLKFMGKKLTGSYALVKYENGYLWVKSNDDK